MSHESENPVPSWWPVGKYVGVALVVAAFAFSGERAGARAIGLFVMVQAFVLLSAKRIPYGWEGQEPSGYITGPLVQVLAFLLGGLGAAFVARPEFMLNLFGFTE
ncbi:hypothetical protein [Methylibium rhizosphaerae]|uniref:hypothetical protein n=1 Tax=Methylibium rhizosphaerae TaxID=2570323 RepID=UPI00112615F6|nr:hypothetical protein [Methylibium rhizosphaerae]